MKNYSLLLIFSILFFGNHLVGQKKLSKDQIQQIDAIFSEWNNEDNPGAGVGIVKDGQLIFSKGYGMASLQHKIPFGPNTVADLGSVAKQFTSFAIALLAEEGKLSLDDDIRKYYPEISDFGHKITIRHLVHHTSGLREIYGVFTLQGWSGPGVRQEDIFHLLRQQKELNFKPGDQYLYCNTSYALLGAIIEKVSGQSFEDFFQSRIFKPLGMNHTYIMDHLGEIFQNGADSYMPTDRGFVESYDNSSMFGQGGFYSNIEDMSKWLANFQEPKVGNKNVMEQILETGKLNSEEELTYAFGLRVGKYRGVKVVEHSGSSAGFRTWMRWCPEQQIGIIIQTNRSDAGQLQAIDKITDILLSDQLGPVPNSSQNNSKEEVVSNQEYSSEQLNKFVGTYYSPEIEMVYTFYFDEKEKGLFVKRFRSGSSLLSPSPEKDFFSTPGMRFKFERDDTGRVISFRVSNGRILNMKFFRVMLPSF